MAEVTADAADPVIYEGSYTTDGSYADRFVRDSFRYRLKAGMLGQALGIFAPAVLVALIIPALDPLSRVGVGLVSVVVFAGITIAVTALGYRAQVRKARLMIPVGSTYEVTLRQGAMSIRDWVISSENAYSLWRSAEVFGDHLVLRRADGRIYTPLARELFTPEAETWLIHRIQNQAV